MILKELPELLHELVELCENGNEEIRKKAIFYLNREVTTHNLEETRLFIDKQKKDKKW